MQKILIKQLDSNKREIKLLKPKVPFYPWEGVNYKDGLLKGKKLLILGESHYDYEDNMATIYTVERYLKRREYNLESKSNRWQTTYTRLTKVCLDKINIIKSEVDYFWNSIVFYNYITKSLAQTCKQKDKPWKDKSNTTSFLKVINFFLPGYMMVLGKGVWDNLPSDGWEDRIGADYFGFYNLANGNKCYSTYINHPASHNFLNNQKRNPKLIFRELINYDEHLRYNKK